MIYDMSDTYQVCTIFSSILVMLLQIQFVVLRFQECIGIYYSFCIVSCDFEVVLFIYCMCNF